MMTDQATRAETRDFLDLHEIPRGELRRIINHAAAMKLARRGRPKGAVEGSAPLRDRSLAMIFEKSSTRTRVSFEMAMHQLGGSSIVMQGNDMQLGRGESIADTARVLSRYVDAIMLRANSHETLLELAQHADIPVINALTDRTHPCQVMADVMTFEELRGDIGGRIVTWVGDGNNMATSWIHAAAQFGCELRLACPPAYAPDAAAVAWAREQGANITVIDDPMAAVAGSDCVIADTWVSMGDADVEERLKAFGPYQVNEALMALADPKAIFMHCLPAYRGQEVSAEVLDGPQSVIWTEAENRLHVQKAILLWCFGRLDFV